MSIDLVLGGCLVSQDIRNKIDSGLIKVPKFNESKIQPSSFDPTIGDEIFILETESNGLFRPSMKESVYTSLLKLPSKQRKKVNIADGFEMKKGFTYLVPLNEKIILNKNEYIKSSPKSSLGRLFINTRLVSDFNPGFDELNYQYKANMPLDMWLMIQPLAFNLTVHPNTSFNQLRFFNGHNAQLSTSEILDEFNTNPLLFVKRSNNLVPATPFVTDGLQIHLDLDGTHTDGIIGLKARNNPGSIDLNKIDFYDSMEYFDPVLSKSGLKIKRGDYYLLFSKEVLNVPPHLNFEVKSYSHVGFSGPLHFAGFIDNGFKGDLVFEVRSDELATMKLEDNMPVSKLDIYRTKKPDKLYSKDIGSNYQAQVGPRVSKHFKSLDYAIAAKNYEQLNIEILVQEKNKLLDFHGDDSFNQDVDKFKLIDVIQNGFYHTRSDCEDDDLLLQPVPYVLIFGNDDTIFSYLRASDMKDYAERKLFGKRSIGVGGHIEKDFYHRLKDDSIIRYILNEKVEVNGIYKSSKFLGTIYTDETPVDSVHFGLIYKINLEGFVYHKNDSIESSGMIPIDTLINKIDEGNYETWNKILLPHLHEIKNI